MDGPTSCDHIKQHLAMFSYWDVFDVARPSPDLNAFRSWNLVAKSCARLWLLRFASSILTAHFTCIDFLFTPCYWATLGAQICPHFKMTPKDAAAAATDRRSSVYSHTAVSVSQRASDLTSNPVQLFADFAADTSAQAMLTFAALTNLMLQWYFAPCKGDAVCR